MDFSPQPENTYPRVVFSHRWGWDVVESAPGQFRLHCPKYGFIAVFTSCRAAVDYMNQEFLTSEY